MQKNEPVGYHSQPHHHNPPKIIRIRTQVHEQKIYKIRFPPKKIQGDKSRACFTSMEISNASADEGDRSRGNQEREREREREREWERGRDCADMMNERTRVNKIVKTLFQIALYKNAISNSAFTKNAIWNSAFTKNTIWNSVFTRIL